MGASHVHAARPGRAPETARRQRGAIAVEFAMILVMLVALSVFVGELHRVALIDVALARATHRAALAAGRAGANCQAAFEREFARDGLARWLLDVDSSGSLDFAVGGTPGKADINLEFLADDGVIQNGVAFGNGCGAQRGSWMSVRASVSVRTRFGARRVARRVESWAVYQ